MKKVLKKVKNMSDSHSKMVWHFEIGWDLSELQPLKKWDFSALAHSDVWKSYSIPFS